MKKLFALVITLGMLLGILGCGSDNKKAATPVDNKVKISIVSAASGGAWYSIGGAIAELYKTKMPGGAITECAPGAGISNVFSVSTNEAQMGFGFPIDVINAENGVAEFKGKPIKNIRGITAIYPGILHIAVTANSNINSIADLKGKVICTQPKGNTAETALNTVLQAYGMTYKDLKTVNFVGFTDAVNLVKDGHADAIAYMSTYPYAALKDLAESKGVKLLGIDPTHFAEVKKINSGYETVNIPGGSYKGTDKDVVCISAKTILFTNESTPENVAYNMTKILYENQKYLITVNKSMENMTPQYGSNTGIKLHPGAEKYYKEVGALK